MKIKIYDCTNKEVEIELPGKSLKEIHVFIASGDEIVTVFFEDDTGVQYDSGKNRFLRFCDGKYTVTGDNIQKWIDFRPKPNSFASYERKKTFE